MSRLQIIQIIVNLLLKEPVPAWVVSQHLLKKGFKSDEIYKVIEILIEDKQLKINDNWELYLNPPTDS